MRGGITQSLIIECSADANENVKTRFSCWCALIPLFGPMLILPPPTRGDMRGVADGVRSKPPLVGGARELLVLPRLRLVISRPKAEAIEEEI